MATKALAGLLVEHRDEILRICAKHDAHNVRVFGSRARGDNRPDSDLDLLVETGPNTTQWWPGGLIADLEELLGISVDIATEAGIPQLIREEVLSQAVQL